MNVSKIAPALWIIAINVNTKPMQAYAFFDNLFRLLSIPRIPFKSNVSQWLQLVLKQLQPLHVEQALTSPKIWGPLFWTMMKEVANRVESRTKFAKFLYSLTPVLPCKECAKHWQALLEKTNLRTHKKLELLENLHAKIKQRIDATSIVAPKIITSKQQLPVVENTVPQGVQKTLQKVQNVKNNRRLKERPKPPLKLLLQPRVPMFGCGCG